MVPFSFRNVLGPMRVVTFDETSRGSSPVRPASPIRSVSAPGAKSTLYEQRGRG